jgi:hypothetical protein
MQVPDGLTGAVLAVEGKSPFRNEYRLGTYAVSAATRGFTTAQVQTEGYRPSGGVPLETPFGFTITDARGTSREASCTATMLDRIPSETGSSGLGHFDKTLSCTFGEGSLEAAWQSGVTGTLMSGQEVFVISMIRGIEGDNLLIPSGIAFGRAGATVAALETVGVGRLLLAENVPPELEVQFVAASIALRRWESMRSEPPPSETEGTR